MSAGWSCECDTRPLTPLQGHEAGDGGRSHAAAGQTSEPSLEALVTAALTIEALQGRAPVEGSGFVGELPFTFRARWDGWDFMLGSDPSGAPGAGLAYEREGIYGEPGGNDASTMPLAEAERLIRWCAAAYLLQCVARGLPLPSAPAGERLAELREERQARTARLWDSLVEDGQRRGAAHPEE